MKKASIIIIVVLIGITVKLYTHINAEDQKIQRSVYSLLEQDNMSETEKEYVNTLTDSNQTKESYVVLDDEHAMMFERHFGHKR